MYITYEEYAELNTASKTVTEDDFEALERKAERYLDRLTLTVDNVKKLQIAFPTDDSDILTIKECLVELMNAIHDIETAADLTSQAVQSGRSGIIASASSGSESISYVTNADVLAASMDPNAKTTYLFKIIRTYLDGVQDSNGVNLLYGGRYPCILTR